VAIDFISQKAMANDEVFKFVIVTLLNDYANSKVMGMDAVYVHIVDTYYKTGKAFWLDDAALFRIINQSDRIKPILIGKQAPQMVLQDTNNIDIPLYSLNTKYTMILFWDVDCGHCQKELPKVIDMYPEFAKMGGEIYAVYSQEEWEKWAAYLREKKLPWVNVGNKKLKSDFQVKYNVDQTPIIFILDKDKKIVAKKLGADQVLDFLKRYEGLTAGHP
ncbi:MAG: peroxiredoxin family protein, partial [Chitinophagales bacterium]